MQRYTNIEVSGASYIFDPDDLVTMLNRVPSRDNLVIYCNRDIKTAMDINALNKSNGFYTQQGNGDIFGRPVTVFQGIPVRQADMIVSTETVVGA